MQRFMTIQECAAELQVCSKTVYRAVWNADLPAHRVGGRLRLDRADVEEYLRRRRISGDGRLAGEV